MLPVCTIIDTGDGAWRASRYTPAVCDEIVGEGADDRQEVVAGDEDLIVDVQHGVR